MINAINIEITRLTQVNNLLDARNELECLLLKYNKEQIQLYRKMLELGEGEVVHE
jgi:hypothetical protein